MVTPDSSCLLPSDTRTPITALRGTFIAEDTDVTRAAVKEVSDAWATDMPSMTFSRE